MHTAARFLFLIQTVNLLEIIDLNSIAVSSWPWSRGCAVEDWACYRDAMEHVLNVWTTLTFCSHNSARKYFL